MSNLPPTLVVKGYKRDQFNLEAWLKKWEPYQEYFNAHRESSYRAYDSLMFHPETQTKEMIFVLEPTSPELDKIFDEYEQQYQDKEGL